MEKFAAAFKDAATKKKKTPKKKDELQKSPRKERKNAKSLD